MLHNIQGASHLGYSRRDCLNWHRLSENQTLKNMKYKYPNHVTSYYVQQCVAVHIYWVKAYAELNLT